MATLDEEAMSQAAATAGEVGYFEGLSMLIAAKNQVQSYREPPQDFFELSVYGFS